MSRRPSYDSLPLAALPARRYNAILTYITQKLPQTEIMLMAMFPRSTPSARNFILPSIFSKAFDQLNAQLRPVATPTGRQEITWCRVACSMAFSTTGRQGCRNQQRLAIELGVDLPSSALQVLVHDSA